MPFSTDNTVDMMMALNSFGKEFDPQSIPSYNDWLVNSNNTFDPFGLEPSGSTSNSHTGIPLHFKPRYGFHADQAHGSSKDATRIFPQEVRLDLLSMDCGFETNGTRQRSRFAFAQTRIEHTVDRWQIPIPTKTISTTVPRAIRPQHPRFQRGFFAQRKPTLAAPKAVRPLPTWLTHFEDYENELLAEFCPSEDFTSSLTSTPAMVRLKLPLLNVTPLSGSMGSGSSCAFEGVSGWCFDKDGEETEDYEQFEFDTSDSGSDSAPSSSESSALADHWTGTTAFHWPAPYQGPQIADGEGHSLPGIARPLELLPESSPSLLCQAVLTNPPVDEPVAAPPNRPTAASFIASDDVSGVAADWYFAEADEELGCGSGSSSGSFLGLLEEGWYNQFDLTGRTFPVLPGLETPSLVYPMTIPLPDMKEREDAELDAIVISPRSPAFGCWR